jgi:ribosome biogenesis SPOUT family RNA methylase Rps3
LEVHTLLFLQRPKADARTVTKLIIDDKIPLDEIPYVVSRIQDIPAIPFRLRDSQSYLRTQDHPTIRFNATESVEMPFRTSRKKKWLRGPMLILHPGAGYVKGSDGEPILPKGMKELLQSDLNKTFDEF